MFDLIEPGCREIRDALPILQIEAAIKNDGERTDSMPRPLPGCAEGVQAAAFAANAIAGGLEGAAQAI